MGSSHSALSPSLSTTEHQIRAILRLYGSQIRCSDPERRDCGNREKHDLMDLVISVTSAKEIHRHSSYRSFEAKTLSSGILSAGS